MIRALTLVALLAVTAPAAAEDAGFIPVGVGRDIPSLAFKAPGSHRIFCDTYPFMCAGILSADPLPEADIARLRIVNAEINAFITYRDDPAGKDVWTVLPRFGDCEDYAISKLMRLIVAGIPRHDLRLATVLLPDGEPHLVLVAQTVRGSVVLDNRTDDIKPWRETPYRWLAMEVPIRGGIYWYTIEGAQ